MMNFIDGSEDDKWEVFSFYLPSSGLNKYVKPCITRYGRKVLLDCNRRLRLIESNNFTSFNVSNFKLEAIKPTYRSGSVLQFGFLIGNAILGIFLVYMPLLGNSLLNGAHLLVSLIDEVW